MTAYNPRGQAYVYLDKTYSNIGSYRWAAAMIASKHEDYPPRHAFINRGLELYDRLTAGNPYPTQDENTEHCALIAKTLVDDIRNDAKALIRERRKPDGSREAYIGPYYYSFAIAGDEEGAIESKWLATEERGYEEVENALTIQQTLRSIRERFTTTDFDLLVKLVGGEHGETIEDVCRSQGYDRLEVRATVRRIRNAAKGAMLQVPA